MVEAGSRVLVVDLAFWVQLSIFDHNRKGPSFWHKCKGCSTKRLRACEKSAEPRKSSKNGVAGGLKCFTWLADPDLAAVELGLADDYQGHFPLPRAQDSPF
jgi:hypothetical protein